MAHFASILFFTGLLVALGFVLEFTVRAYWAEIVAALRGVPPAPARRRAPAPGLAVLRSPPRVSA